MVLHNMSAAGVRVVELVLTEVYTLGVLSGILVLQLSVCEDKR